MNNNQSPMRRKEDTPWIAHQARQELKRQILAETRQGFSVSICPVTGVQIHYQIAGLPSDQVFSVNAPFAAQTEARKLIKHVSLSRCSSEILAGLVLALAGPTGLKLIDLQHMSALEANAALSSAEHSLLCTVLRTLEKLSPRDIAECSRIAMPECANSITHCLKEWNTKLLARLPTAAYEEIARAAQDSGITILSKQERNALALAKTHSSFKKPLAKYEVSWDKSSTLAEAEEEFREQRKHARTLWASLQESNAASIKPALASTMRALLTGKVLAECGAEMRAKLITAITRLGTAQAQTLARIIKEAKNPYLRVTQADVILDEVTFDTVAQPRRSLAEIIAAKKAGASAVDQCGNTAHSAAPAAQESPANGLEDF